MAKETEQVLRMNGGVGEESYANNSLFQKMVIMRAKPVLEESMMKMYNNNHPIKCLKVADLGCSSGPNALQLVHDIVNIVEIARSSLKNDDDDDTLTFQFFLNDLFGNDFNNIFESLPHFYKMLEEEEVFKYGNSNNCFINATPGNFYGRLFPSNSIHFFHSNYSVHWLTQAPKGLTNNGEEVLNKDNIHVRSTDPPAVHKAYLEQFEQDFKLFLKLRAEELVEGGAMVLTLVGKYDCSPWALIGMALHDMVSQNLIEEVKLEGFNIPLYGPTEVEIRKVIEEEGSFTIQRLQSIVLDLDVGVNYENDKSVVVDENVRGEFIAKHMRAIGEPILKSHFGEVIMDELFLRFKQKLVQQIIEVGKLEQPSLILSLTKNA